VKNKKPNAADKGPNSDNPTPPRETDLGGVSHLISSIVSSVVNEYSSISSKRLGKIIPHVPARHI